MSFSAFSAWLSLLRDWCPAIASANAKKKLGKNGGKGTCRYSAGVPKWLPNPNERDRSRYDCQRKTNNHNCAENND